MSKKFRLDELPSRAKRRLLEYRRHLRISFQQESSLDPEFPQKQFSQYKIHFIMYFLEIRINIIDDAL